MASTVCRSLCAGLALALSPAAGAQTPPFQVTHHTVTYRSIGDLALKADVYDPATPSGAPPRPVLVLVHGGGWTCGNRDAFGGLPMLVARNYGLVVVTPEYRLAPITVASVQGGRIASPGTADGCPADEAPRDQLGLPGRRAPFPAALDDLQFMMRQLRAQASALRIDGHRMVVLGASAGAQLAGLLAASPGGGDGQADAVISVAGPWDLTDPSTLTRPGISGILRNLFGGSPTAQQLAAASPALRVPADGRFVPTLFIHGAADTLVPPSQSIRACARMGAACAFGHALVVDTSPDADPHDAMLLLQSRWDDVIRFMAAFVAAPAPAR
jgi:acetyl esterase/lipase